MKCALLSNINVGSIARQMERHEVHIAQGYGVWTQELADPTSGTFSFGPSSIFLVIDGAELLRGQWGLEPMLAEFDEHLTWIEQAAERSPEIKFFISTIDVPAHALRPLKEEQVERRLEQHWHAGIARASARHANIYIFDVKALVEQVGRSLLYSNKRWYLGGLRFSTPGEKLIARELDRILDAQFVARKKCLLLDLDNTLWGGVIGEDGLNGIQLSETGEGARYRDFQLRIRELSEMGVYLRDSLEEQRSRRLRGLRQARAHGAQERRLCGVEDQLDAENPEHRRSRARSRYWHGQHRLYRRQPRGAGGCQDGAARGHGS
jgi:predicted enzyme involved in methoxymalonyl-ACP biosynthesis